MSPEPTSSLCSRHGIARFEYSFEGTAEGSPAIPFIGNETASSPLRKHPMTKSALDLLVHRLTRQDNKWTREGQLGFGGL